MRRPIRSGRIKPALIAICGPMMPLTTPAAMTHEIARGLERGLGGIGGGEPVLLDEGARRRR